MMWKIDCDFENSEYKFEQLRDAIIKIIEYGDLNVSEPLPAINQVSDQYKLSKVTVGRAYQNLKKRGFIENIRGKFFIVEQKASRLKILLVFNKLEDFKRNTYEAIQDAFAGKAIIDLQVYYSKYNMFNTIMNESLNKYDYYIIMPHFYRDSIVDDNYCLLKKIPAQKLLFLDKKITEIDNFSGAVLQDFGADMQLGLEKTKALLAKYDSISFVRRKHSHHPEVAIESVIQFCVINDLSFSIVEDIDNETIVSKRVYICTTDKDLAQLIRKMKNSVYSLGKDVGLISYNDSSLKELLNVTVFSTNFYQMGRSIAEMIINQKFEVKRNPFDIIIRDTL